MRLPISAQRLRALSPYLVVALGASVPAWIVRHPPVQDLPYHLATIRVIHSFHDPFFGFDQNFVLQLGRTEYLLYYLAGSALAYLLGVVYANVVLISAYFAGTVLAVRDLLNAMGRDPRGSLFVVPLLVNVLFIYGLLPFLLGIPLMFWGLAAAFRHFERPTWGRGLLVAGISVALFYSHIIPFGLFGLGFAALFPWGRARRWLRAGLPTVPVLGLLGWWLTATDAGRTTAKLMTGGESSSQVRKLDAAMADVPAWLTNVFKDDTDERWLIAYGVLVVATVALRMGDRERVLPRARRYALVPIACVLLYFATPVGHDFIWPLAQRFAILFAMTAVPLLGVPRGGRGVLVTAGAVVVAAGVMVNTARQFIRFEREEVGDLEQALGALQPGRKVCALIFDKASRITNHQPFIHFGSYYQVEKGGVVMFTFAGYPHWPFDFQPGKYPPPGGPARRRWEWTPEQVGPRELTPYYDYVLVRGNGFRPGPGAFRHIYEGSRWSVWEREPREGAPEEPGGS